jgi:hypothetical protein
MRIINISKKIRCTQVLFASKQLTMRRTSSYIRLVSTEVFKLFHSTKLIILMLPPRLIVIIIIIIIFSCMK